MFGNIGKSRLRLFSNKDNAAYVYATSFVYLCGLGASLACFIPQFTGYKSSQYDTTEQIPSRKVLLNPQFEKSVLASFAITIPTLVDMMVDLFVTRHDQYFFIKTSLWMLILSSCLMTSVTLFYIIPNISYKLMSSIIPAAFVLVLSSILCLLNSYGSLLMKWKYIWVIMMTFAAGQLGRSAMTFLPSSQQQNVSLFILISSILSSFLFVIMTILWIRRIVIIYQTTNNIPENDMYCSVNIFAILIFYIIHWVIQCHLSESDPIRAGLLYHTYCVYLISGYAVVMANINGRFMRRSVLLKHVKHEAETKRMLIGYFSHEIRTPLNSILIGLQIIEKDLEKGQQKHNLLTTIEELHSQCDLAVDILNDLLLYERLEEGIIDLNFKPVSMKPFLQKKIKAFLPQCKDKGINLNLEFIGSDPLRPEASNLLGIDRAYCRADEDKIGQVIRTLLNNAIACTPNGKSVTVTIDLIDEDQCSIKHHIISRRKSIQNAIQSLTQVTQSQTRLSQLEIQADPVGSAAASAAAASRTSSTVLPLQTALPVRVVPSLEQKRRKIMRICIRDEGPGIPEEEQATIFDNALSFTAGVLQVRQGQGLGLWISRHIILLHRGDIFVESTGHGQGSVFRIEIPAYFSSRSGRIKFSQISSAQSVSHLVNLSREHSASSARSSRGSADADLIEIFSDNFLHSLRIISGTNHADVHPITNSPQNRNRHNVPGTLRREFSHQGINHMDTIHSILLASDVSERRDPEDDLCVSSRNSLNFPNPGESKSKVEDEKRSSDRVQIGRNSFFGRNDSARVYEDTIHEVIEADCDTYESHHEDGEVVDKVEDMEDSPIAPVVSQRPKHKPRFRHVLVVDDAAMNRKMLCRLLDGHCDTAVEAEDGEIAIEKLRTSLSEGRPFLLVLMDYQMPNMDGPTAARIMREMGFRGPIIGVTGNSLASHIKTFIAAGADRVCSKPLSLSTLLSTLREMGFGDILVS